MLIIFDLDGTLVDSARDLTEALNFGISGFRSAGPFTVAQVKELVGEGVTRLIEKALQENGTPRVETVRSRFLEYYHAHITEHTRPYSGVPEALDKLATCRKAVVSNKNEELSMLVLKNLGLLRHFDMVIGSDSAPEKKPSPVPLLTAMERTRTVPADCLMVGDSDLDILAGKRAGVQTCAVTWGFRSREVLAGLSPDYVISRPDELAIFASRCV